jgi:hypothetical protein
MCIDQGTLKVDAAGFSETLVVMYMDTPCYNREIYNLRFLWFMTFWNMLGMKQYAAFDVGCYLQRSCVWPVDFGGMNTFCIGSDGRAGGYYLWIDFKYARSNTSLTLYHNQRMTYLVILPLEPY